MKSYTKETIAVVTVILAAILTESTLVPTIVAYTLVILTYGFLVIVVLPSDISLRIPAWSLPLLLTIWTLYLLHLVLPVFTDQRMTIGVLIRPPVFILFAILNLFLVPYLIPPKRFFSFITGVSTVLVLIGLPTIYVDYHVIIFEITHDATMNVLGYEIRRITSIFGNPNVSGFFFMIGFVISFVIYAKDKTFILFILVLVNGTGLFLTESRAGYLGAVIGVAFFILLIITNARLTRITVWGYLLASATGVAILANVIPRPEFISPTDLGSRPGLWEGGVQAIVNSPLGYGTWSTKTPIEPYLIPQLTGSGVHSAYLRMFLSTGFLGGLFYALFILYCLLSAIRENSSTEDCIIFTVAIAIATKEIFEGNTIFGISMSSILISITFGYAMRIPQNN